MFDALRETRSPRPSGKRWLAWGLAAGAELAILGGLSLLHQERSRPPAPLLVPVRILRPHLALPALPRAPARAASEARAPLPRPLAPLVQSRKLPPTAPAPVEKPETVEPAQAAAEASDVGPIGAENGVIGGGGPGAQGNTASAPAPHPPTPARPADLATVRSGIARTLVYPPEARRRGWQGRVTLAFTLQADGTVLDLTVRQSSGLPLLDQAALAAIRRAAPFAPPGLDVQVVVPVVFRFS